LLLVLPWLLLSHGELSAQPQTPVPTVEPAVLEAPTATEPPRRRASASRVSRGNTEHFAFGGDVVVKEGERFRDVVVVGGNAIIDGTVHDLVVVLGHTKLGPAAEVTGELVIVAGALEKDPAAEVRGDQCVIGLDASWAKPSWLVWPKQWFNKGLLLARPMPHQYAWSWAVAGVFLLLYLLGAVLFPRQVGEAVAVLEAKPGVALLAGVLAMALLAPLLVVLAISVIGAPLIPFVLLGMLVACFFGKVAVYRYAGQQLGRQADLALLQKPVFALLVGALLCYLIYTVPVIGFVVWCALVPFGLGAALLAFSRDFRSGAPRVTEPVPVAVTAAAASAPGTATAAEPPSVLMLPRVGFWMRLGATLLDAIPIVLLVGVLFEAPEALLVVWFVYHVALWTWKGTTIGGIVFGLKIVRTDGRSINFAVALVRALSAFLSAAVLLLGFFWAGWSADKQSWHDKIAGTVVVRFPKGMALV
jgi:uncharacterized RDD family membrane protein YckC